MSCCEHAIKASARTDGWPPGESMDGSDIGLGGDLDLDHDHDLDMT
jgi:hypothetical protein